MNVTDILLAITGMAAAMLFCRTLPLFLPKSWLQQAWLQYLNKALPLSIMLILLFSSLTLPEISLSMTGTALNKLMREIMALVAVLLSYIWLRNMLFSIVIGILSINLLYLIV